MNLVEAAYPTDGTIWNDPDEGGPLTEKAMSSALNWPLNVFVAVSASLYVCPGVRAFFRTTKFELFLGVARTPG